MSTVAGADEVTGALSRRWEGAVRRRLAGRWRHAVGGRLGVSYHELSQPVSLLPCLRDWLDPAADAKISVGWSREADWLGDGLVAVSSSDYHGLSSTPAGLKQIDTEAWGVRTLDPGASVHRLAEGTLFALGGTRDGKTETETGMSAYSTAGGKLWHALDEEPLWWLDAAGGYVYVPGPDDDPSTVRVIDLADGTLVREVKGEMPAFLVREDRS